MIARCVVHTYGFMGYCILLVVRWPVLLLVEVDSCYTTTVLETSPLETPFEQARISIAHEMRDCAIGCARFTTLRMTPQSSCCLGNGKDTFRTPLLCYKLALSPQRLCSESPHPAPVEAGSSRVKSEQHNRTWQLHIVSMSLIDVIWGRHFPMPIMRGSQ